MERRRPRRPAPHLPSPRQSHAHSTAAPTDPWARRPTDQARLQRWPVRTPALQKRRALTYGAPAPWSAGVLAGLRRTFRHHGSLTPTAPPHRRTPGARRPTDQARLQRWPVRTPALQKRRALTYGAPAPWSAGPHGAPASSPACPAPSVTTAVSRPQHRRTDRPLGQEAHGPGPPAAVAGEDTGAPEMARPDVWSAGPHGAPASSPACPAPSVTTAVSRPQHRRTDGPLGQEAHRPGPPAAMAGEDTGAPETARPDIWTAGPMERRRPRRPAPHGSLVPTAPPCRRSVGRKAHAPCPPAAVAGEDTGAPCRPALTSRKPGPMERRRPRRPAPHLPSLRPDADLSRSGRQRRRFRYRAFGAPERAAAMSVPPSPSRSPRARP